MNNLETNVIEILKAENDILECTSCYLQWIKEPNLLHCPRCNRRIIAQVDEDEFQKALRNIQLHDKVRLNGQPIYCSDFFNYYSR